MKKASWKDGWLEVASDHKYLRIRDLCKELAFVSRRANE